MEVIFITVHDLSPDARIRYCSDSIEDILGYLPHEVKGKSCWDFFHPKELPFAKSIHGRGIELDKAAVLNYCRLKHRDGSWIGCECVFTVVYDVLVASTSIYKKGYRARQRAIDGAGVRRVFSSSPRDPRYHMLSYLSNKFHEEPQPHAREPRAALFLNRFTRTSTIMFATSGVANILGIQPDKLIGKSFYFCIAENCLSEAVKCLESAKANDSLAYLRFWYRDPLQPEPQEQVDGVSNDEDTDEDEDGGVSIQPDQRGSINMHDASFVQAGNNSTPQLKVDGIRDGEVDGKFGRSLGNKAHGNIDSTVDDEVDGRLAEIAHSQTDGTRDCHTEKYESDRGGRIPRFDLRRPEVGKRDLPAHLEPRDSSSMNLSTSRSESEAAPNTRSSSGNSTDLDGNAADAIFDPPSLLRSNSSNTPPEEEAPIEIEAVVSCTSDGLVVVLRRAHPLVPPAMGSASDTPYYANGLFASPWATEPVMPKDVPRATVQPAASFPPMNNPVEAGFMAAIRDVAVFAWSLTGINGSLAQYGRGQPGRDALPPGGLPIWDPNSDADPENLYNGFLGSLHRPFEGMGEPSVVKKRDESVSSDDEILWKRVPTMPEWRRPKRRGHHDAFGADGDAPVDGEDADGGRKRSSKKEADQ